MSNPKRSYRLSTIMMFGFSILSVPLLILVLSLTYLKNTQSIRLLLDADVARSRDVSSKMINDFLTPVVGSLRITAEIAALQPDYFLDDRSLGVIHETLRSADHIDAVFVGLETGFARGMSGVSAERRQRQKDIPKNAELLDFRVIPSLQGQPAQRHQTFYRSWPIPISSITDTPPLNYLDAPSYQHAKQSKRVSFSSPFNSPSTGTRTINISAPIIHNGAFTGAINALVEVSKISDFLANNRLSPNSIATVFDRDGNIIAHPLLAQLTDMPTVQKRLAEIAKDHEKQLPQALLSRAAAVAEEGTFLTNIDGVESVAVIFDIKNPYGLDWRAVLISPLNDFVGPARSTSTLLIWLLVAVIPLQLLLIRRLSRRISRGITGVTREFQAIRQMQSASVQLEIKPALTREVTQLQEGLILLRSTLASFGKYIPRGVVRQLIDSGKPLALGVEPRDLTIMFCDIENFSTLAQKLPPQDLLQLLSAFFSVTTEVISEESGTVDKFIGDAVMAFWGAPSAVEQPELHACRAALGIIERLNTLNDTWRREGKPTIRARFGIHTSEVLVGNIGSNERLSYTAIGDGVNVASRLEGINKELSTTICLSDSVYAAVAAHVVAKPIRPVSVKGRTGEFMVYELVGLKDAQIASKKAI